MSLTPRELLEQDQAMQAREAALSLPDGDEEGIVVRAHTDHLISKENYDQYYQTMRGGICPEPDVFTRHHFVKRFASIRRLILERGHKTVLDLGCLDGWQLLNLAAQGISGVGVDLCPEALAVGQERAKKWGLNVSFFQSAIEDFNIIMEAPTWASNNNFLHFDAVILSEVLEHVLDPLACLRTAVRHLAPGGILYISAPASPIPHHGKLEDAREHLRVFSKENLTSLAKEAGLSITVDHDVIDEEDQGQSFSHQMLSFRRAQISVFCNHVTGGWNPEDVDDLGASEEMVVKVAEAWVRQGHAVTIHQNGYSGQYNGVSYLSRAIAPRLDLDLLILYKTLDYSSCPAQVKLFWTTDLPQHNQAAVFLPPNVVDQLDGVICISEYQRQELLRACPWLSPEKVFPHWVGIDTLELSGSVRDSIGKRVIYASSPDRGLGFLLEEWPKVREAVPDAELRVVYGFDFWKKSETVVPAEQAEIMRQERERLEKLLNQPGVTYRGRLSRGDYLQEMNEASIWAYPCTGGELCCKTALEAQFLGLYPIVIPTMSLQETVQVGSKVAREEFIPTLIRALCGIKDGPYQEIKTPSWGDLALYLAGFLSADIVHIKSKDERLELLPTDSGVCGPLPEKFDHPHKTGALSAETSLDIVMAVAGMSFDGNTDRERGLGGSETAAIQLSRELVKRGHRMTVFSNLPGQPGKFDGVSYIPLSEWSKYVGSASHDVAIIQREPMAFNQQLRSKLNVLWCHDLGLLRHKTAFRSSLWNVDYIVPVSHWHGTQLAQVYELPASLIAPMYNGIDLDLIAKATNGPRQRDRKALIYASRPERGLDLLLQSVFPRLLERDPELTLYIAGYENTVPEMEAFYTHCRQLAANFGPRVKWLGGLSKPDLYRLYSRGAAYVYPSRSFDEVFCITVAEAAACGLPFVGTTLGALPEVTGLVPGFASLVEHPGEATEQFISAFVNETWRVLSDDLVNQRMSKAGREGAETYSWANAAEQWEDFLIGSLELRSANRQRLVRHWWKLGDLNGIAQLPKEDQMLLDQKQQAILESAESDLPCAVPEHVIRAVGQMAANVQAKTVCDLSGSDNIADKVALIAGAQVDQERADFVFATETLDCSALPEMHIAEAERKVKPGGYVCLVVASPGVQQDRLFRTKEQRKRRWVFDNQDMKELVNRKPDLLSIVIGGGALSEYDKRPLSWMLYQWQCSGALTEPRALNMTRRTRLQAPPPSVSACLIVKNSENMLHRCLKSITPYCDEFIVDDNGSTDSTKKILLQYGIDPQLGPKPVEVGFDEARNHGLKRATGDMILWIDSDEELLNGSNFPKYLRWSIYDGFGISQHHFSADPPNVFKPDLPVRLFRRVNRDDSLTDIRFFGFVHEHPEKALNHSVGQSVVLSDVHIAHDGYLTEEVRRRRFDRNIPLMFRDRLKYPNRVLGKFLMIRDWCHLARHSMEQNGGNLTPDAVHYLEAAVETYRRNFLGMTHVMAMDGLQYYNEALQMLNRGFDVQVSVKVGGANGMPSEVNYAGRVSCAEDLTKILLIGASDLTSTWKEKYL